MELEEKGWKKTNVWVEMKWAFLFLMFSYIILKLHSGLFEYGGNNLIRFYAIEGALYLSFFALVFIIKKDFMIQNTFVEFAFFATSLFYMQKKNKELLFLIPKDTLYQTHKIFIVLFLLYYSYRFWKERDFSWKKIEKSLLYIMPVFILERGYYNMFVLYLLSFVIRSSKEKNLYQKVRSIDWKFLFLSLAYMFSICISSVGQITTKDSYTQFRAQIFSILIILVLYMSEIKKEDLKYLAFSLLLGSMTQIYANLTTWFHRGKSFQTVVSLLENSNDWSILLVLISIILFYLACETKKAIFFIFYFYTLMLVLLTQSRGGILSYFIAFILCVVLYTIRLKKWKYILVALLLLVPGTLYLKTSDSFVSQKFSQGFQDYSTVLRVYMRKEAIRQYKAKPLFGWGVQTFQDVMRNNGLMRTEEEEERLLEISKFDHSHNNLWEILRSFGTVGIATYFCFFLSIFLMFWKAYWKEKEYLYLIPILSMMIFEIYGQTDISLYMRLPKAIITLTIAVFLGYYHTQRKKLE